MIRPYRAGLLCFSASVSLVNIFNINMAEESDAEKPPAQESLLSQPVCGHSELPYTISPAKLLQNSDAQGQLTAAVDELLDQLQSKFDNVSKEVFGKRAFQSYLKSALETLKMHIYWTHD